MKLIYSILRFAKKREHLEEIQQGHLRLNTLGYYLNYEGYGNRAIADKNETLIAIYQPEKVRIFIGKDREQHEIKGVSSPIKIRKNKIAMDNVLCMYAIHAGRWAEEPIESVDEFVKFLEINNKNKMFGKNVLHTTNTQEFLNRIVTALTSQNIEFTMGPVEYIDEQKYNGRIPNKKLGFVKSNNFSYQNEYRLYIPNKSSDSGIKYLDVGNLSDITAITVFDELKNNIQIEFP
jgi:hypothetical protein